MADLCRSLARSCIVAVSLITVAAACGGGTGAPSTGEPTASPMGSPGAAASPAGPAGSVATTGHIGDTLTWVSTGGNHVDVTVVKLTDPATSPASMPSGDRWVGVELTIDDHEGDASNFDSVAVDGKGPDGTRYGANTSYRMGSFTGCTPATTYTAGTPETFCTGFLVPVGVKVASVGYSVVGVDAGAPDDLTWAVP